MVQLIRNGGSLSFCTRRVLTSGTFVVERQYASNVSCSQFSGTPLLLSGVDARVTESSTVIRSVFFDESAFASTAANKRPACKTAILRIIIKPSFQTLRPHLLPNDPASQSRSFATFCSPGVVRTIAFPAEESLGGQTQLRAIARRERVPRSSVASTLNLHWPNFSDPAGEPRRARFRPAEVRGSVQNLNTVRT